MRNIMIDIEYDGTNYNGWQMQINGITIQQKIMEAVKKLTGEDVTINGSGRTDAKVHARGQVANFYSTSKIPIKRFPIAINHFLPDDITILEAREVPIDFHARYWAQGKIYSYQVNHQTQRSALLRNYSYHFPYQLELDKMEKAAGLLIGTHDFKGFMSSGSSVKSTVRSIYAIKIEKNKNSIWMTFEGSGFLYNMVRIMVGTLLEVGNGRRSMEAVQEALKLGNREKAGHKAPPQGLFLDKVFYPLTH
ncbi:tRNA pseudouridine synthase A [Clostridium aceticum]|uniref:tRNA pseudouridine synthase A n=1 Tax=Clostridium aceticum TaxID=84022 RepID=A0A0D8I919_9CLOT|nr:tRNA pseudouridine(38-40) synthase TruA [Clostridium aceticum]AKL97020.1 tRNA pseudouridine synthase A [Clostridium aceticum]KJF25731.1 pseudouridine synthase [Clostridium aceticum]